MNLQELPNCSGERQIEPAPLNLHEATGLIVQRAAQLVAQLIEKRGHDRPPFLSREFAHLLGFKQIIQANLGDASAVLLKLRDGYVMKVNQSHHAVRQNFSCAHEIGHVLFNELRLERHLQEIEYRTFNPQGEARDRSKARERLCDIAATELLMPEFVFRRSVSHLGVSVNSIERLANSFAVSVPAAAIRIAEVSSEPCIAVQWTPRLGTKTRGLKPAWCVGPQRRAYCAPIPANIERDSAVYKAYESETVVKSYKKFKLGMAEERLPMESKGFGHDKNRYVISLAFLGKSD